MLNINFSTMHTHLVHSCTHNNTFYKLKHLLLICDFVIKTNNEKQKTDENITS